MNAMFNWVFNQLKEGKTLLTYGSLRVASLGVVFFVPIILATQFSPETFGMYSLGMMIVYFFYSIFIISSGKPSVIYGTEEIKENQKFSYIFTSRIILSALAITIFLVFIQLFKMQLIGFTNLTGVQVYLLMLVFIGKTMESFGCVFFITLNKRIIESIFLLLNAILSISYLFVLYLFFETTIEKVFLMYLVAPIVSLVIFIPKIEFKKILPLAYDHKTLIKLADYTKWMMLGGAAIYLLNWCDNIILRIFVPMEEIGVYNLGYQFFKGTTMAILIISNYFLPFVSHNINSKEKISNYLVRKRIKLIALGLFLIGCLFFILPYVVQILYTEQYWASVLVFRILLIGSICSLCSAFYDPIFHSLKRYKFIQAATMVCVCVNLLLDYILIGRIGFLGAAIATSISYFLLATIKVAYFRIYCAKQVI